MKLQFKQQQFQIDAVKAVVDCFDGQPIKTNRFTLERSREDEAFDQLKLVSAKCTALGY